MVSTADQLIDRRRLRRKLTFWRVAAIAVAALAILGIAFLLRPDGIGGLGGDHIAKVKIEGTILEDEDLLKRLTDIRISPAVKGVILVIDSPGGTTAGGEAIYEAVRAIAAEKPVVAQVGTLAASAGYMIASAADQIVARQSSIVGSIGVLVQFPDLTGLMDKVGIKVEAIKSSPLKAEPSPFTPTTDEERAMVRALVLDSYDWFVDLVAERRSLNRTQALALADGSIFTGRQALQRKLVDRLGGEETAVAWLEEKGVASGTRILEWKRRDSTSFLLGSSIAEAVGRALGLQDAGGTILRETGADRLFLDGLVSVWHP
jgi:protease-4